LPYVCEGSGGGRGQYAGRWLSAHYIITSRTVAAAAAAVVTVTHQRVRCQC